MEIISALGAGANVSIKICGAWFQLTAVDDETANLLKMTEHVDRNVTEARRLRRVKTLLIGGKRRSWMDEQINDCQQALQEVQQLIEPARVDMANKKSINPKARALWVLRDGPRVAHKYQRLNVCHQTLHSIISELQTTRDMAVVAPLSIDSPLAEPPPYTTEMESMFNWPRRMRSRQSFDDIESNDSPTPPPASIYAPSTSTAHSTNAFMPSSNENRRPSLISASSEAINSAS